LLQRKLFYKHCSERWRKRKPSWTPKIKQELDLKMQEIKVTAEQIGENYTNSITQVVEERKADMVQVKNDIAEAKARQAGQGKVSSAEERISLISVAATTASSQTSIHLSISFKRF
jgi:hypothetical protein